MPVTFTNSQISAYEAGGTAYDFLSEVASGTRKFACGLYKNYRGWTISEYGKGLPPADFLYGVWDSACSQPNYPGLPALPSRPFTGGQCSGVYDVRVTFTDAAAPQSLRFSCGGPLGGVATIPGYFPNGVFKVGYGFGQPVIEYDGGFYVNLAPFRPPLTVPVVQEVLPRGFVDNCGNPPLVDPVNPPPSADRKTDLPVPRPPGRPPGNWSIPLVYAPIQTNFTLNFDAGGINVTFDAGGITFDLGGKNCSDADQQALLDAISDLQTTVENLGDDLDDLRRRSPVNPDSPYASPYGYDFSPVSPPSDSSDETGIDRLAYVQLSLTQTPINAKTQWGRGAPDLKYAGWFEFKVGSDSLPREPVHFERSIFKAPAGADGFAYTLYGGFRAAHSIITYKE